MELTPENLTNLEVQTDKDHSAKRLIDFDGASMLSNGSNLSQKVRRTLGLEKKTPAKAPATGSAGRRRH